MTQQKTRYTWIYSLQDFNVFLLLPHAFEDVYQTQVLVMIKHRLGNSQINSIPAWSKEFSYITFLHRTLAKVNALARGSIHSQREIKDIFDPKTHPFIN